MMKTLNQDQLSRIGQYVIDHGREIEKATWRYLFTGGSRDAILQALLPYQNGDGGFGHGLEADIQMPGSSAIASAEAILIADAYGLDCEADWFRNLLAYFERTAGDGRGISSFWEKVPPSVDAHPHAPWWNYAPESRFSPNPCAVVATAFLKHGNDAQRALGSRIARRCIDFIKGDELCSEHDCYCLQTLVDGLQAVQPALLDETVLAHMARRILGCVCTDAGQWTDYVAQPLDLVAGPQSRWHSLLEPYVQVNIDYWLATLQDEGYWQPNFSWGVDSDLSRQVTMHWRCHLAVKRARILMAFAA